MTITLLIILATSLGAVFPRRLTLLIPVIVGWVVLSVLVIHGERITDTPIPFLVAVGTVAVAFGGFLRILRRTESARLRDGHWLTDVSNI